MFLCSVPLLSALFASCTPPMPLATGYVEGEYVQISALSTAQILTLSVASGDRVEIGQTLVDLETRDAQIGLAQAKAALSRSESQLANLRQGRRPEEMAVIEAALASAKAQADEAQRSADRLRDLSQGCILAWSSGDGVATGAHAPSLADVSASVLYAGTFRGS